jgi:hypothetical protein
MTMSSSNAIHVRAVYLRVLVPALLALGGGGAQVAGSAAAD